MSVLVVGDLLARDRRSDAPALRGPTGREYDYRRFCTTAWKVGNFFRHFGVRDGSTVALVTDTRSESEFEPKPKPKPEPTPEPEPEPEPILAFLGAALLGGIARFDPPHDTDARVLITPNPRFESESDSKPSGQYDLAPGSQRIVYGGSSDDPSVAYFEQGVWSENPTKPPNTVEQEQPILQREKTYSHAELLDSARSVVDVWGLTADDRVAVRAPLREPETIVAGVIAPLLVGGTILLPDKNSTGDCAVVRETGPEPRVLPLDAIEL